MREPITVAEVVGVLGARRFQLTHEHQTQAGIAAAFAEAWGVAGGVDPWWAPEWRMSRADRQDFAIEGAAGLILVEVKHFIAKPAATLRQLERYAEDARVAEIILATGRAMSLPAELGARAVPLTVVNLSRGWL